MRPLIIENPSVQVGTLPAKVTHPSDFFVVGGPVQPDRASYVVRAADRELRAAVAAQKFAYVLCPRASGKSSLMARTIRELRAEGQLAAVVDLTQIGARGEGVDAGRWYYSIAYRVLRELRLKVDLQAWWQDKSPLLNEQRLVEFFWDIVLAHTSAPVTVFFDEAERAVDLPFSTELFAALRSCYMRRVSEPEFARLNFVVLGVATPAQLCADPNVSPFTEGRAIALEDFTLEESYTLVPGLGREEEAGQAVMQRIMSWTRGHPYLTQKVARGIARKGGRPSDVETVVRELLLAPGVSQEEPLLNYIRATLTTGQPGTRQALALLSRLAKGGEVLHDPASQAEARLRLAGLVSADENGMLRYRNRVFERIFDQRWSKTAMPVSWQRPATAAVGVLVALLIGYWYTQVLPRPYIDTLNVVSQDYALAEAAYDQLRRIPGFRARADRLLADAMLRRSTQSNAIADVQAADRVLRSLPGREQLADELFADFWLRQSRAAAHRGERDVALVYTMAALDGRPAEARAAGAELIGTDYARLQQTYRLPLAPIAWEVDAERGQIVLIDETHRVQYLALDPAAGGAAPQRRVPGRLTAEQHVAVSRELDIDADGEAGNFNLLLTVQHGRASDIVLTLTAPSGASAQFAVPQPRSDQQSLIFSARGNRPLAALADEPVRGQWRLLAVDRRTGEQGSLISWGLQFAGSRRTWEDVPEQGIALPDPARTEQVTIVLARDGRQALAAPSREGAEGAITVWDLATGERAGELPVATRPVQVALLSAPRRAAVLFGDRLELWDSESLEQVAAFAAPRGLLPVLAVSPDESRVAVASGTEAGDFRLTVLASADGRRIGGAEMDTAPLRLALGDTAASVTAIDGSRRGRVFDVRSGTLLHEFTHNRSLVELVDAPGEDAAIAVDEAGGIFAWSLADAGASLGASDSVYLGTTAAPDSVAMAANGQEVSFVTPEGLVAVSGILDHGLEESLDHGRGTRMRQTRLGPAAEWLVSSSDALLRVWRLDGRSALPPVREDLSVVALDPTGSYAAFGYRGGHLRTRPFADLGQGAERNNTIDYIGHRGPVTSLAVNAAHNLAASGGGDGLVRLWDLASAAPNEYFMRHPAGSVETLALSADGRWLVSGGDFSARVWQTQTGEQSAEIPVDGVVSAAAFSPDAALVAVGDSAGNIFLGAPRGTETLRSARTASAVRALAFSPDGGLLASGDRNGNLVLFDVLSATPAESGYLFPDAISWIAFGPDGRHLYVQTGAWVHELERRPTGLVILDSRLLPSRLLADVKLALTPDGHIRALGGGWAASVQPLEFGLDTPLGTPLAADSPLLARNWDAILGLLLDRDTGTIRIAQP